MSRKTLALAAAIAVIVIAGYSVLGTNVSLHSDDPRLKSQQASTNGQAGEALYNKQCSSCHGNLGTGTANGPPLVHRIYEPNHHADFSFYDAIRNGVRAHHWRFGDMPPLSHVSDVDAAKIVAYIRGLQRAKGIY